MPTNNTKRLPRPKAIRQQAQIPTWLKPPDGKTRSADEVARSVLAFAVIACCPHQHHDNAHNDCTRGARSRPASLLTESAGDVLFRQFMLRTGEDLIGGADFDQVAEVEVGCAL